jgi:hypothetical protein
MATMQDIVDRGRVPLQDSAKTRFTDAVLLRFANDFVQIARRERPDLFFGQYSALPGDLAVGGTFPLGPELEPAAVDYVTGRAEATGSEAELEGRAVSFLRLSAAGLTGAT